MNTHRRPSGSVSLLSFNLAPHLVIFLVCFFILIGAILLTPAESGASRVQLGRFTLPQTCVFKNLTGLPCPGCGLTRSMSSAMHGDVVMSFTYHRLGLLTLFYIFLQFVFRLGLILIPETWLRIFGSGALLNQAIIVLGILFAVNWVFTLLI